MFRIFLAAFLCAAFSGLGWGQQSPENFGSDGSWLYQAQQQFSDPLIPLDTRLAKALENGDMLKITSLYDSLDLEARQLRRVAFMPQIEIAFLAVLRRWDALADSLGSNDPFNQQSQLGYTLLYDRNGNLKPFDGQYPQDIRPASAAIIRLFVRTMPEIRRELVRTKPPNWEQIDRVIYHVIPNVTFKEDGTAYLSWKRCAYPDTGLCKPLFSAGRRYNKSRKSYSGPPTFPFLKRYYGTTIARCDQGIGVVIGGTIRRYLPNKATRYSGLLVGVPISFEGFGKGGIFGIGGEITFGQTIQALGQGKKVLPQGQNIQGGGGGAYYGRIFYRKMAKYGAMLSVNAASLEIRPSNGTDSLNQTAKAYTANGVQIALIGFYDAPIFTNVATPGIHGMAYNAFTMRIAPQIGFSPFSRKDGVSAFSPYVALSIQFTVDERFERRRP